MYTLTYEAHLLDSKLTQAEIDKWLFVGAIGMGTLIFGFIGLPLFMVGLYKLNQALKQGLAVRPMLVTLIGYMIIVDAGINTFGWALDCAHSSDDWWMTAMSRRGSRVQKNSWASWTSRNGL
jgi:hypothetical protein